MRTPESILSTANWHAEKALETHRPPEDRERHKRIAAALRAELEGRGTVKDTLNAGKKN